MKRNVLILLVLTLLLTEKADAELTYPVKGAWVTNVGSDVLLSRKNIREAVQMARQSGLNTLCVVVWNNGYTMYPSATLHKYFGVYMDPVYGQRDPLKEMIEAAHAAGIKVIAWFEFGFAASYGEKGKHILQRYPHWAARDREGRILTENGFTWMNSFHPEVQQFMTEMIKEVVVKYQVDGIQGDDRLPAAPIRSGYDAFTSSAFREAHQGNYPPFDYNDPAWTKWRSNQMNAWGKQLYAAVKKINPKITVAHAPSIFPWSREHYLQDWPTWLKEGYTDIVMPQVYRYKPEAYQKTLDDLVRQMGPELLSKVFPGLLTSLADGYLIEEDFLKQCVHYNRSKGIMGEVFFYFEGIRRSPVFYQKTYPQL